jgi:hypothetical protein
MKEVVGLLERWSDTVDLVDQVFNADDAVLAQFTLQPQARDVRLSARELSACAVHFRVHRRVVPTRLMQITGFMLTT